jgi:histone-lysine N-methyltransferase SETMAR
MTLTANLGYDILPHPPYSTDLAWSNFFLFPRLKKPLRGKRFQDDDDVISAVEDFLNSQNETYDRWGKCVALQVAYVEKD